MIINTLGSLTLPFTRHFRWMAVVTVTCMSSIAQSKPSIEDRIEGCSLISNALERLVCFDSVADSIQRAKTMPLTQEEHEGGNSRTASSTEIDVGATPERVEREVVTSKEPAIVAQAPTLYTGSDVQKQRSTPKRATPKNETIAEKQTRIESFGAESIQGIPTKTRVEKAALYSEITALVGNPTRKLGFVLENGQVWEKLDGPNYGLPREGDKVIIEQRSLGAYYLRKANANRSYKVVRLR